MRFKKGDNVKIIAGKDKGKTGKITHAFPDTEKIVVEGVNVHKKHSRPKKQGQKGQIIQMPMPIHMSNAMLVCKACGKATRVGMKITEKEKIRVCKKCGGEL
jgi:large subunit ribosomal protein L24